MKLIVGLGNIGSEYEGTRHNVGFSCLELLAEKEGVLFKLEPKLKSLIANFNISGEKVLLVKPTTYMNLSGEAVEAVMNYYKIDKEDLIVICDDLDMEVGKIRFRTKGSAGGHNGLKNIIEHLGTDAFNRIKIGISRDKNIPVVNWVLGHFSKEDKEVIEESFNKVSNSLSDYLRHSDIQKMALDLTK